MTKREYVNQTIAHRECDRVPFSITLTGEAMEVYGDQLIKDFPDKEVAEDYRKGVLTKGEAAYLSIGNYTMFMGTPWWDWDWENIPSDIRSPDKVPTEMPPTCSRGVLSECSRYGTAMAEKYQRYMVCAFWGSHWEKAYFLRGIENYLADLAGEPEFAEKLLDFIIDKNMGYLPDTAALPACNGILLGSDWGTQNDLIMSPETWRKMLKKGEKRMYGAIKKEGKHVFVHSCGCILKIMDDIVELGVDVLNPVQPECMDIAALKEQYGNSLTFWGGISTQKTLPYGTPKEVREETERTIKLMSRGGGYITCPSQEIQTDVPYENLKALIETARAFG
ncbi:MAG: hypothetical protein FWF84_03795 [Kiritimatiellaeota bacterium]|nr:hypothetical protein [Kiritimatiellota bacterium]